MSKRKTFDLSFDRTGWYLARPAKAAAPAPKVMFLIQDGDSPPSGREAGARTGSIVGVTGRKSMGQPTGLPSLQKTVHTIGLGKADRREGPPDIP